MQTLIRGTAITSLTLADHLQRIENELHTATASLLRITHTKRIRKIQKRLQPPGTAHKQIPQMRTKRRNEMQRIETLAQDLIENQQRRTVILRQKSIHQTETILVIQDIQIPDHIRVMDVRTAESHCLVENSKRIAHRTVSLVSDHMQRLVIHRDALLSGDIPQIPHDVRHADTIEIIGLATAQDGRDDLMLLSGGKDEDRVCRRLLESLQERIESRLRKHMDLIDDIDAVPAHLGRDLHLVHQGLDVIHTVVRRRIQLVDAIRTPLLETPARLALAARLHVRTRIRTVDGLRENARGTGFADTTGTAEQIGMRELPPEYGILQGARDVILTDEGLERIRTVLAGRYDIV